MKRREKTQKVSEILIWTESFDSYVEMKHADPQYVTFDIYILVCLLYAESTVTSIINLINWHSLYSISALCFWLCPLLMNIKHDIHKEYIVYIVSQLFSYCISSTFNGSMKCKQWQCNILCGAGVCWGYTGRSARAVVGSAALFIQRTIQGMDTVSECGSSTSLLNVLW